jgi:hypothetical protein
MRSARAAGPCLVFALILGTVTSVVAPATGSATVTAAALGQGSWSAPVTLFSDSDGAALSAVSCASAKSCVAVGTKGGTSGTGVASSGATTWSLPDVVDADGGFTAASCVAVGGRQYLHLPRREMVGRAHVARPTQFGLVRQC